MKFNILSILYLFLVTSTSLNAMEELAIGPDDDFLFSDMPSLVSTNQNDHRFNVLVSDDYRTDCMNLFNQRDAQIPPVLKKHRADIRATQDRYTKELTQLKLENNFIQSHYLEDEEIIKDEDTKTDYDIITASSVIIRKQLLEKKIQHTAQQIETITNDLEEYNNRKFNEETLREGWTILDEPEDTSYTQLTTKEREFLINHETTLKKDANSFYHKHRLDRLSAKERYEIIKDHQKNRNMSLLKGIIGATLSAAGGIGAYVGIKALLVSATGTPFLLETPPLIECDTWQMPDFSTNQVGIMTSISSSNKIMNNIQNLVYISFVPDDIKNGDFFKIAVKCGMSVLDAWTSQLIINNPGKTIQDIIDSMTKK